MKPSPCLHPRFVTCPDGVKRNVPCGKCSACLVNKGLHKVERIKDYISSYPYQFLVTLTYEDNHLPVAMFDDISQSFYHPTDCDYDGVVYSLGLSDEIQRESEFIDSQFEKYGGLPVLSHRHLILFKKRFRYYFKQLNLENNDIFIYACGEYGPTTFRPHYHLIFGTYENIRTSLFEECVRKAWSFCHKTKEGNFYEPIGFIDVKRSFGGKSIDYIAKYICATTHLPACLANAKWKPFTAGSTRCCELLSRLSQSDLREVFYHPTFEVTTLRNGRQVTVPVPSCYYSRFFPLISRFHLFSDYELYALYGLYNKFEDVRYAYEMFVDGIDEKVSFNELLERNKVFDDMKEYSIMPRTLLQNLVLEVCFFDSDGKYIHDEFITRRNFMRLYYVSRRVCLNAKQLDVSVSTYVDKIKSFYSKKELFKLKKFYEFQNELLEDVVNPVGLGYIFTLYYNTTDDIHISRYVEQFGYTSERIEDIEVQKAYKFLSDGILLDTTKTKKCNDKLQSLGRKKRPYVPLLNKSIVKFNSI